MKCVIRKNAFGGSATCFVQPVRPAAGERKDGKMKGMDK